MYQICLLLFLPKVLKWIVFKKSDQHFAGSIVDTATVFDLDKKWPLNKL